MQHIHIYSIVVLLFGLAGNAGIVNAQTAGVGADFNKADRASTTKETERQRVEKSDPVGNALIVGAVIGSMNGAAVGATSVSGAINGSIKGAVAGAAVDTAKKESK